MILLRQKSAWNNADVMVWIVRELGKACREQAPGRACVLLLDAVRIHFHERVVAAIIRSGFSGIYVPALMTWLLQPLDTHCFSLFKRALKKAYIDLLIERRQPVLRVGDWLHCLTRTIAQVVVDKDWSHAFSRNGYALGQHFVADRVLEHLGLDEAPFLAPRALTVEEFRVLLPRRARIHNRMLTAAAPRGDEHPLPLEPPPLPPPLAPPAPWLGRTRSTSTLALPPPPPVTVTPPSEASGSAPPAVDAAAGGPAASTASTPHGPIALRTRSRSRL